MMYITMKDTDGKEQTVGWHVGEPKDSLRHDAHYVVEVQADEQELFHIINHQLCYCPAPLKNVVRFFGDEAKRIVANL